MRAGQLDRLITIQTPTKSKDAEGTPIVTWNDFATCNAMVTPAGSMERYRSQQNVLTDDRVFQIYYLAGVTSEMQVIYNGLAFGLVAEPREIGRRVGLELLGRNVDSSDSSD